MAILNLSISIITLNLNKLKSIDQKTWGLNGLKTKTQDVTICYPQKFTWDLRTYIAEGEAIRRYYMQIISKREQRGLYLYQTQ